MGGWGAEAKGIGIDRRRGPHHPLYPLAALTRTLLMPQQCCTLLTHHPHPPVPHTPAPPPRLAGTVLNGLKQIVTNFGAMSGQLSGPVAIVAAGSEVLRADSAGLFQFAAIVNINLAAVNILPLPALDGGYLFLLAVEAVRGGRKLPAAVEGGIMASGFLLLTALGLGLVVRDTINLL